MKTRTIVLMMALCIFGLAVSFAAENPNMGTWKLNEAKSKFPPGATKNTTVVYEAAGDSVKVTGTRAARGATLAAPSKLVNASWCFVGT